MLQITIQVSGDASRDEINKAIGALQSLNRDKLEELAAGYNNGDPSGPPDSGSVIDPPTDEPGTGFAGTDQQAEAEITHDERPQTPDPSTDQRVDKNGVPFDHQYCGEAREPFYSSGPRIGQWKKKRGLADQTYDQWYARAREITGTTQAAPAETVDASAAFGNVKAHVEPPPADQPQNAQEFMIWISERQAAGEINDNDLHKAYRDTGVAGVHMLFDPAGATNPGIIEERVKALHARLMLSINQ